MAGMLETFKNAFKIPEIRAKLIFTLVILILYRLGAAVPVPFIDPNGLAAMFEQMGDDSIFGYLNILSGDAFSKATLFALGIGPYITSSIVMQLLTVAIPALEKLQKSGEDGKKKITQITRYLTVGLGLITGYGYYMTCRGYGLVTSQGAEGIRYSTLENFFVGVVIVACYSAGSALIMWLGEKINENGIGNGISMILFANIISRVPSGVGSQIQKIIGTIQDNTATAGGVIMEIFTSVIILAVALIIVAFVVFMSNAERRIPVQYSKKVVGRKMYGGQRSYLPIKVNMSGVMPIIFASSMVSIPITILSFIKNPQQMTGFLKAAYDFASPKSPAYIILEFILIIAFAYFYINISFNPREVANNLNNQGGVIPGHRAGRPTEEFITKILNKIVLIGGLFLGIIAVFPLIANSIASAFGLPSFAAVAFGGSSLLIVVGVALETTRELESQMMMRNQGYKGFLS